MKNVAQTKLLESIVFLTQGGQNLFNADWTQGNLYRIENVTSILGTLSCWLISVIGFGIVIFSIIKNAASGLYVVNPKLWDRVDEIKTQAAAGIVAGVEGLGSVAGGKGNAVFGKLGGLLSFLFGLIPNIKAITDFDGDEGATIDKKLYFSKSLPLLVAQIFIGMLIFFGYPAKIANWVGTAGTQVIDMVLTNVDPIAVVSNISGKFVSASFSTAGSNDPFDRVVYNASQDAWQTVVGHVSDMEKDPRQLVAFEIEENITKAFEPYTDVLGSAEGYRIAVDTQYMNTVPTVSSNFVGKEGSGYTVYTSTSASGIITYKTWFDVSKFSTGSPTVKSTDYLVVTFNCTPVATSSVSNNTLTVLAGYTGEKFRFVGKNTYIDINGIEYGDTKVSESLNGVLKACYVQFVDKEGSTIEAFNGTLEKNGKGISVLISNSSNYTTLSALADKRKNEWDRVIVTLSDNRSLKYYESGSSNQSTELYVTTFEIEKGKGSSGTKARLRLSSRAEEIEIGKVLEKLKEASTKSDK